MQSKQILQLAAIVSLSALTACQANHNEMAMQIGAPPANTLELRSMQTRQLSGPIKTALLHAATQTMQDLGFTIQESASDVGVISATKSRDAEETGQVAGAVALTLLGAVAGVYVEPVWDTDQKINVTFVETPSSSAKQSDVRVSFDRTIRNNQNNYRSEIILEPKIYQEFFQKLEQSLFLEKSK
jgi:hypothetical protein